MKILKYSISIILSFLIIFAIFLLMGTKIVNNKILNKEYVISKMEETEFYLQISREVESGFENYIYQSGLPEDTIEDIFTDDMIKNDVNSIIDYVYEGKEIQLSDEILRENLDLKIQNYLQAENKTLNEQGKENISKFEDLIVDEYKNNVNVSDTLYSTANSIIQKLSNIMSKIGNLPIAILCILIILIIIINIKDLLLPINFLSISLLSTGILLKIGINLIFSSVDLDNLLVMSTSLSNLIIAVVKENLYLLSDYGNIYIICGIVGILIVAILKNSNVNEKTKKVLKPKQRKAKIN